MHVLTADLSLARCSAPNGWGHVKPVTPVWSARRGWVPAFLINSPGARAPAHSPSDAWGSCSLLGEGQRWAAQGWFGARPGPRGRSPASCFTLTGVGASLSHVLPSGAVSVFARDRREHRGPAVAPLRRTLRLLSLQMEKLRPGGGRRPAWVSREGLARASPPLRFGETRAGAAAGPGVSPVGLWPVLHPHRTRRTSFPPPPTGSSGLGDCRDGGPDA